MIRLLPTVCHDCGISAEHVLLSPYLDFQLCDACLSKREKEFRHSGKSNSQGFSLGKKPRRKKSTLQDDNKPLPPNAKKKTPKKKPTKKK